MVTSWDTVACPVHLLISMPTAGVFEDTRLEKHIIIIAGIPPKVQHLKTSVDDFLPFYRSMAESNRKGMLLAQFDIPQPPITCSAASGYDGQHRPAKAAIQCRPGSVYGFHPGSQIRWHSQMEPACDVGFGQSASSIFMVFQLSFMRCLEIIFFIQLPLVEGDGPCRRLFCSQLLEFGRVGSKT